MKILCVTPWFPAHREDQFGNYILDSLEALVDLGHEIIVLITQPWRPKIAELIKKEWTKQPIQFQEFSQKLTLKECEFFSIPRNYLRTISNNSYRKRVGSILEKLAIESECQLIHAHTELAGVAAVDIGKKLQIPTILTIHGINTDPKIHKGYARRILFEHPLTEAHRVIFVGDPLTSFFKNYTSNHDHFRIVYNGFRLPSKEKINRLSWSDKLQFISVSNLVEGKGIDINLYALAKLKQNGILNWYYTIVGDGFERKHLEGLVTKLELKEKVSFLGALNHNKVYEQLKKSDIFILPSYREAFGIAYLEAMSLGLLTIGVIDQGPQAFIKSGKTGFLIPPKDPTALTRLLQNIFETKISMFDIAMNGQSFVYDNFTWHHHAKKLESIYQELLYKSKN